MFKTLVVFTIVYGSLKTKCAIQHHPDSAEWRVIQYYENHPEKYELLADTKATCQPYAKLVGFTLA